MSIADFFNENAWNIVIGIGTGIFSSILVSKIFLIYQDVKGDFLEVVKNTTAFKNCIIIYETYRNPEFPKKYGTDLPTNYSNGKKDAYFKISRLSWEELNSINCIYTKYMDKELCCILNEHSKVIGNIHEECDEKKQRDEYMRQYLSDLEKVLIKYDSYQKKLFKRTLFLVFTDKLTICLMCIFAVMIFVA